MSTLKVNNLQVGQDGTAANNYTLYQPASPDGTVRLGHGVAGSVTDILTLKNSRLGIGTDNPDQKLSVLGLISTKAPDGITRGLIGSPSWDTSYVAMMNGTLAQSASNSAVFQNSLGTTTLNSASGQELYLKIGNSKKLTIDSSGNLMVGQTTQYGVGGGGNTFATFTNTANHRTNLAISNQNSGSGAGAALALASYGVDWIFESTSIAKDSKAFTITEGTNERLRITSGGRIGIGDIDPSDALTVYRSNVGNPTGITIRNTEASSNYSHARLRFESKNGAAYGEIWADVANSALRIAYNSSSSVYVKSNGDVGIGVNPEARLHVEENLSHSSTYYLNADAHILVDNPGSGKAVIKLEGEAAIVYGGGSNNLIFADRQNERMRITSAGWIGIDQSSPQSKVQIDLGDSVNYQNGDCFTLTSGDGSSANLVNKLNFGLSSTNNYAWIQSIKPGTDSRNLVLQPSGGNVGIGDVSPSQKLNVGGNIMLEGDNQFMYLCNQGTGNAGIYVRGYCSGSTSGHFLRSHSTNMFTWEVTGQEKMRLTSDGNLHVRGNVGTDVVNITGAGGGINIARFNTGNPSANEWLGALGFKGYANGNSSSAADARIHAVAAYNHSGSSAPSNLIFSTKGTSQGPGNAPIERLRILHDGTIKKGSSNSSAGEAPVELFFHKRGSQIGRRIHQGSGSGSTTHNILNVDSWQGPNSHLFAYVTVYYVSPVSNYGGKMEAYATAVYTSGGNVSGSQGSFVTANAGRWGNPGTMTLSWSGSTLQINTFPSAYIDYSIDITYISYDGAVVSFY